MTQAIATATTDAAALEYLLAGPSTRHTSVSELARQWGWNRTRVLRRLRRWSDDGLIAREIGDDGSSAITLVNTLNTQVNTQVNIAVHTSEPRAARARIALPQLSAQRILAAILLALAIVVAFFGLRINAWYGASLARDAEAGALLAGLSIAGDAVALLLPATARLVKTRLERTAAWTLWVITLVVALMAAIGFASVNIADTSAARDKTAIQGAALKAQIAQLTTERAALHETRPLGAIEAELAAAQGLAAAVWSATAGCNDVTRTRSATLCAPIQELRKAHAEAARAREIDAALEVARNALAALPAIGAADPQAEMAAALLRWISGGFLAASAADIAMLRIIGMTLLPQIAGMVFMLGFGLWRTRS